jgi:hypothetical protein
MGLSSRVLLLFPVLLLLAGQAAAHGHHRHLLQGRSAEAKAKRSNKARSDGKKFDFLVEDGGAAGYLRKMNQTKLKKALDNARWNKGEDKLAKLLDQDPDFVSAFLLARVCSGYELDQNFALQLTPWARHPCSDKIASTGTVTWVAAAVVHVRVLSPGSESCEHDCCCC